MYVAVRLPSVLACGQEGGIRIERVFASAAAVLLATMMDPILIDLCTRAPDVVVRGDAGRRR